MESENNNNNNNNNNTSFKSSLFVIIGEIWNICSFKKSKNIVLSYFFEKFPIFFTFTCSVEVVVFFWSQLSSDKEG